MCQTSPGTTVHMLIAKVAGSFDSGKKTEYFLLCFVQTLHPSLIFRLKIPWRVTSIHATLNYGPPLGQSQDQEEFNCH